MRGWKILLWIITEIPNCSSEKLIVLSIDHWDNFDNSEKTPQNDVLFFILLNKFKKYCAPVYRENFKPFMISNVCEILNKKDCGYHLGDTNTLISMKSI